MSDILDIIRATGAVQIRGTFTLRPQTFTADVYNALHNGSSSAVVLAHDAPPALVEALNPESIGDDVSVFCNADTYSRGKRKGEYKSAKALLGDIHRRNAANKSAPGETYGRVQFTEPMYADDTLVGFIVSEVKS
jgi:hypothetical protein